MHNFRRLGNRISVPIPRDADGFIGRECPDRACEGYFKVEFGTGLKADGMPCHCPYCGHSAPHDQFWTREQIEYAKSVALRKFSEAVFKDLKSLEFEHRPRGAFGIGISLKVKPGSPTPIRYYREKKLETVVACEGCTLRYAIYGVFAFCPDCGQHNSKQILDKNLDLASKEIALAATVEQELANHLVADALENVVSAFDGFGREACRVHAKVASDPAKAEEVKFQNLDGARKRLLNLFGFDLSQGLAADEWKFVVRCFQKRHLLAHSMGVVDEAYLKATLDMTATLGRKVVITADEVSKLIDAVRRLGQFVVGGSASAAAARAAATDAARGGGVNG